MKMTKKNKEMIMVIMLTIIAVVILVVLSTINVYADNKCGSNLNAHRTIYVGGTGAGNYSTIQGGINVAGEGDTVFVYNGVYYENVIINKTLTLIGEDRNTTIIDGGMRRDVICVTTDEVNIDQFTIINSSTYWCAGIRLSSSNNTVSSCSISENCWGIYFNHSSNNILRNNTFYNNKYNIDITGNDISDYYEDINTSNTVNGQLIYYLIEQNDLTLDGNLMSVGYLALISCNNITITNLNVENSGHGLLLVNTHNSLVRDSTFSYDNHGIYVGYCSNITITHSTVTDSYWVRIYSSSHNVISDCNITTSNYYYGVEFSSASYNNITRCNISSNWYGVLLHSSSYSNSIIGCHILGVNEGIGIAVMDSFSYNTTITNCIISHSEGGIYLSSSSNQVTNCLVSDCIEGVSFYGCSANYITYCTISNTTKGIRFYRADYNVITNCNISSNEYGIVTDEALDNIIYHNNFLSNTYQAYDEWFNSWDNGSTGNYWSDYKGTDINNDDVGDEPYYILGEINKDNYPLMEPVDVAGYKQPKTLLDSDNDGVPDAEDNDDDNDGYNDTIEQLEGTNPLDNTSIPADLDGDYIPDSMDNDIDGDGYLNINDAFPNDPTKWGLEEEDEEPEKEKGFIPAFETAAFLVALIGVCVILLLRRRKDL